MKTLNLTEEMKRKYLEDAECPFCGNGEQKEEPMVVNTIEKTAEQLIRCQSCGAEWVEEYKIKLTLTGIHLADDED
jgi:uncharacterized Zn finger protein